MTCHTVTGNGSIWEGISFINAWMLVVWFSNSSFLNVSDGVFKRKSLMEN